ncbi:MAG: hypothetical protein IT307_00780, partial [Chloroflexi bacterium]|nr:hypothetical protein [Chloroflexota bacterium]
MAIAFASVAACHYCTLPINRRPIQRGGAGEAASTVRLFCCQGCAWAFEILGGGGEGVETTLAAARLLAAFAAGMVVMVAGWSRYLDAWLSRSRPETLSVLIQPGQLETLFARVYEPLAAGAVFALLGWPILRSLPRGPRAGAFGLNTLVTLGVLAAYVGSLVSTVRGWGPTYYDTATMILLLV